MAATRTQRTEMEGYSKKLLPSSGLIITSIVAIVLLATDRASWNSSGRFYHSVNGNRNTTQTIVQIIDDVLGALNVYAICSLFNFFTRLRLEKVSSSLNKLGFWNALSMQRLDVSLPYPFVMILLLFRIIVFIPNAIWAGALTPARTTSQSYSSQLLDVPQYSDASKEIWGNLEFTRKNRRNFTSMGIFTYSPNYDLLSLILNQPTSGNVSQIHKKPDNTRYSFSGRSYGVGSSVGLVDKDVIDSNNLTLGYNYTEIGYRTQVTCAINPSSNWQFLVPDIVQPRSRGARYPSIWFVNGSLPNNSTEGYTACSVDSSDGNFALVGQANNAQNNFSIAATGNYTAFDKISCGVDFTPASFLVAVNRTDQLIVVTPLQDSNTNATIQFEPTSHIVVITMRMPTSFSQQHACDLYTSLVGNTFTQNIMSSNPNITFDGRLSNDDPRVAAQAIDNTLLAFSTAQLMIANDTYSVVVLRSLDAVRIGKTSYIALIFAINFAIVLLCLFESIRTRGWKGLSTFDYTDIKAVTVGASKGGNKVGEQASKLHERSWGAGSDDADIGKIKVRLENDGEDVKLVGVEGDARAGNASRRLWRRKVKSKDTELEALRSKGGLPEGDNDAS